MNLWPLLFATHSAVDFDVEYKTKKCIVYIFVLFNISWNDSQNSQFEKFYISFWIGRTRLHQVVALHAIRIAHNIAHGNVPL